MDSKKVIRISRDWVTGRAVVDGHTVTCTTSRPILKRIPEGKRLCATFWPWTTLATPLRARRCSIGAILIAGRVHPFLDKQIKLLETFADQA